MLQVKVLILQKKKKKKKNTRKWKVLNRLDQYNRRNNLEIQGIPSTVGDGVFQDKVIEIFETLNIRLQEVASEDCHRLRKSNPKIRIVRFANRKNCYAGLGKNLDLQHTDKVKLHFLKFIF